MITKSSPMSQAAMSLAFCVAALLFVFVGIDPAAAGGSWLSPVQDRYEPGDSVTLVGYVGASVKVFDERGPFTATIIPLDTDYVPLPNAEERPVGSLQASATDHAGYLSTRVAITFSMPADAVAAPYRLSYCARECDEQADFIGDLIGAIFHVGVTPPSPVTREWAFDEPEIANLAPNAEIAGPGYEISAAQVLAGELPDPPNQWPIASASPTVGPRPTVTPTPMPTTTAATAAISTDDATSDQLDEVAVDVIPSPPPPSEPQPSSAGLAPLAGVLLLIVGALAAASTRKSTAFSANRSFLSNRAR